MTLELSTDDVLALVANVEEWFSLDEHRMRWRVEILRARIRVLEDENVRLRTALARATAEGNDAGVGEEPVRRVASADAWAIPEEPAARPPVAAEQAAPRRGARFACRTCGELNDETDLRRVDGSLVCASCDVRVDDPPVTGGRYR